MRSHSKGGRGRSYAVLAATALVAPLAVSMPATAQAPTASGETKTYIVQLSDAPLASYDGGTQGIPATTPASGDTIDVDSAAAERYADYLGTQRSQVLQSVGAGQADLVTTYDTALNGFAAKLTPVQVAELRKSDEVVNVWEDEIRTLDTITTPDYLGLSGEGGVWETQFGGTETAGEGIIVGIIDTGIDIDNPSFAPTEGDVVDPNFEGICDGGELEGYECNAKMIGARWYGEEFGNTIIPIESESPKDINGHGSHVGGTSAGNFDVPMEINGIALGNGSGMAPAAQVATYKALWQTADGGGSGTTAGLVAAIDDATADGVDVINYSISGSSQFIVTPDEIAFFNAAAAGVFVSTSAGNSGPAPSTVAHNSPWTTTVAASTHDRGAGKTVTLGDDSTYEGVGVGEAVGPAPLVEGVDVALEGVSEQAARECWLDADQDPSNGAQPTLDPAATAGTIVICDRGTVARVDKSAAVAQAGGVGMIQANTLPTESLNADFHSVPSIHVDSVAGAAIHAYQNVAGADATATISEQSTEPVVAPEMAGFSSVGPALAGGGDLLKPDITAPGVDVVAAYHENLETGDPEFTSISGTSMSAPHIAGLGALLASKYPLWDPMQIKSAMMTTARQTNTAGEPIQRAGEPATALDYGSGEVVPADSYNPGLVYNSGPEQWLEYACAIGQLQLVTDGSLCDDTPIDPSDLNYPSIAIGDLAGRQTVTRTVTNVSGAEATFTAEVEAPAGLEVTVSPETLTIPDGGSASYEVTFQYVDAPLDAYTFGALTWVSGEVEVRSPLAIQPLAVSAPDEIAGEGPSGSESYEITAGINGELVHDVDGLVASDVEVLEVTRDPATTADATTTVEVTDAVKTLRFATYDSEVSAADIDIYLTTPSGEQVVVATGTSEESFTLDDPEAGTWQVAIDLFSNEPTATVPFHPFLVTEEDAGNLTVDPQSVTVEAGDEATVTIDWAGLNGSSRYLGAVNYTAGGDTLERTLVSIDVGAAVTRIGGEDRYETAALISELYGDDVDTVYVASGEAFADALSASAPAAGGSGVPSPAETGALAAPILLTEPGDLPGATIEAIENLEPSNIVVLGGTKAVETSVSDELAEYGEVTRIGGEDRYDTSALIAATFGADIETIYVASGEDYHFADSLSGGALAGSEGAPVLLTRGDRVDPATAAALEFANAKNVVVLGGSAAVSDDVSDAIGATERLGGETRYDTTVAISQKFPGDLPATHVASGVDFPDALAGAANAGYLGVPVLLSDPDDVPDVVMEELDRISPEFLGLLGGPVALDLAVQQELNAQFPVWVAE